MPAKRKQATASPEWPGLKAKQAAFLHAFIITGGQVVSAARAAKIARCTHYDWLASEKYAEAFKRARDQAGDVLESEAIRRAHEGTDEPVYFRGTKCGEVRRYPDGLMQFLLRGVKPDKYREKVEHSGPDGGPIQSQVTVTFVRPDPSQS